MEEKMQNIQILDLMDRAAFCAENGVITHVNAAAAHYLFRPGMQVASLLETGADEYASFTAGQLHLTLRKEDTSFGATIVRTHKDDIVLLEEAAGETQLRSLALAAAELRIPLSNAVAVADRMLPIVASQEDAALHEYTAQLNRRIMQMQRIISNMSDCGDFDRPNAKAMECVDICNLLDEILSHAAQMLAQAGFTLEYSLPEQRIYTLAYPQKLERAVYNMLSNAAKFSPQGSTIVAQLAVRGTRLAFSVTDPGACVQNPGDMFTRYLRQPGLEDPRFGLGLGMVLIRATATLHGGAVLVDHPTDNSTRVTMTMAVNRGKGTTVHSPVIRIDYAGERDHCLLELSDILPYSLYGKQNMP